MKIDELNKLSETIIGKSIEVHKELGPGLLESAYEACLSHELLQSGYTIEQQKPLPVRYKGLLIECGYRIDLLVEGAIIVELKSVENVLPIHKSQILSYLRLSHLELGLLINFNVELLKNGIHRIINNRRTPHPFSVSSVPSVLNPVKPVSPKAIPPEPAPINNIRKPNSPFAPSAVKKKEPTKSNE